MTKDKDIKTAVPALRFPEFRDGEEWISNKIDHVCKIGNGRDYKHLSAGDIPVYGSGGYMISVDDFLYDGESACIGRKGTIDKPIFLTGKFWAVDTLFYTHSFHKCLSEFLYLIFQQINWYKYNEAGGVPSLLKTTIGNIDIFIPNDENEQKKIVDCLSCLDDLISAVADKIETLKEYKKGLMQQLFPPEGKTTPILRFPEFQNEREWKKTILESLCNSIASGKNKNNPDGNYNLYGSTGIIGKTDTGDYNGTYILVARVGTHAGFLTKVDGKFGVTDNTLVINLKLKGNIDFVYYLLYNKGLNNLVFGSGQPLITGSLLKNLEIAIPSSIEQQKIADCLSSVDELISTETAKLDQLKVHKKGLMQQLFPKLQ